MIEVKTKESMDIFDSTGFDLHNGDTNIALDYMVTVFLRCLDIPNAFKGGYMLTKLLGGDSRATRDIDFSIQNKEAYESIKNVLEGIANKFLDVGIIDDYNEGKATTIKVVLLKEFSKELGETLEKSN